MTRKESSYMSLVFQAEFCQFECEKTSKCTTCIHLTYISTTACVDDLRKNLEKILIHVYAVKYTNMYI